MCSVCNKIKPTEMNLTYNVVWAFEQSKNQCRSPSKTVSLTSSRDCQNKSCIYLCFITQLLMTGIRKEGLILKAQCKTIVSSLCFIGTFNILKIMMILAKE